MNDPNVLMRTFCKRCSFSSRCFFPVSILNSKNLKIPVQNNFQCDQKFKLCTFLGKLQNKSEARTFTLENIKFAKTSETIVIEKCTHVHEIKKGKITLWVIIE